MLRWLHRYFQCLLAAGIGAGLLWGPYFSPYEWAIDACVQGIIFLGFFSRPPEQGSLWPERRFWLPWAFQKLGLPLVIFLVAVSPFPDFARGVMLIAALPAAAVSPAMARLTGGDFAFSLRALTSESFLSCLTIPCLFALSSLGQDWISPLAVGRYLVSVLLFPMLVAEGARRLFGAYRAGAWKSGCDTISIFLITILVMLIAAVVRPDLLADPRVSAALLLVASLLAPAFASLGVLTGRPRTDGEAISLAVKNMYVNIGLGLGLASAYLDRRAVLLVLAYMIPINLMPRVAARIGLVLSRR